MSLTQNERLRLALAAAWPDFTYRQQEMLKMYLLSSMSFQQIGTVFSLKPSTVKKYLRDCIAQVERVASEGAA